MPKHNKTNQKNDYLKEGQKLNVQLIDQIFKTEQFKNQNNKIKPNINQNTNYTDQRQKQNQPVQNKVNQPSPQNNQQYYNKPIPYETPVQEQNPNKIHQTQYNTPTINQTQYNTPNINQYSMSVNQSMYLNNLRANNQAQLQHQNTLKEHAKPQNHQNNENINQGNRGTQPKTNLQRKISA